MIFRRLAAHLREQNWAAISIEFVLLVVGVFLGIQVANWNEDRQDRQAEQRYLRELVRDLRSDTRGLQGRLENTLSKFALSEQIILEIDPAFERPPFLPSVDTSPKPAGIFRDHAFAGLATTSLVTSSDATFRELVQTGKLAVLFVAWKIRSPWSRSARCSTTWRRVASASPMERRRRMSYVSRERMCTSWAW
jgi:hypothetical protein